MSDKHLIKYSFYRYRCFWRCSCGKGQKPSKDTYAGARKHSLEHLKEVDGDLNQPVVMEKYFVLLEEFKKKASNAN